MTILNPNQATRPANSCPSWCDQQYGCEWEQYSDHAMRHHGKAVAKMKGQLVTLGGPGELVADVELASDDRIDVDWQALTLRRRLTEPMIQLHIASRGPVKSDGERDRWDESLTDLTADQAQQLVEMLTKALRALADVTNDAA